MGQSLVLLIGLIHAILHQLVPSNDPKFFSVSKGDAALRIAISEDYPDESFPISEWSISTWVYTTAGDGTIFKTASPLLYMNWAGSTFRLYDGTEYIDKTTMESFPTRWIFYQLGSTATMTYALATVRGLSPYYSSSANTNSLVSASTLQVFRSCAPVEVTTI